MIPMEHLAILVVEDDPDDYRILEDILREIGTWTIDLTWAPTYEEGLAKVREEDFGVVLADYQLGARSGLDFVREPVVRQRALPVIIVTGQGGREVNREIDLEAAVAGAADYLHKGNLTAEILERSIRYTVEFRRRHRLEARLQALVENSPDLTTILTEDGIISYVSPSLERILGFDPETTLGTNVLNAVHPAERPLMESVFRELVAKPHEPRRVQCRMAHADGEWRVLDVIGQNLLGEPLVGGIVTNAWDITEQRLAEEELQKQRAELQERVKELRCLFAVDRALRDSDSRWESVLHRVVESIPGGFRHPEVVVARVEVAGILAASEGFRTTEVRLSCPVMVGDERIGEVEVCVTSPVPGEEDAPFLPEEEDLLGAIADRVGEAQRRRRAERDLRREEAYFRTLAERSGAVILVLDPDLVIRYAGREAGRIVERPASELIGTDALSLVRPADRERARQATQDAVEHPGQTIEVTVTMLRPNGEERLLEFTVRNLLDDPAVEGLVVTLHDITERVRQEERTRFQAELLDRVGQPVLAVDREYKVVYWNRAAEELTGWGWEEIRGKPVLERLLAGDEADKGLAAWSSAGAGAEWTGELTLRRKDGGEVIVQASVTPAADSGVGSGCRIAVGADITGLRQAERRLRDQKALLETVVSSAPMTLFALDPDGRITLAEGKGLASQGLDPGALVGVSLLDMYADRPDILDDVRRALVGESFRTERRLNAQVLETWWSPVADGRGTLGVSLDITEQAGAVERIRFQAELLDAVGQAVIATDLEGRVIYWNRAAEDLYGWRGEEALGADVFDLTVPADGGQEEAAEIMETLRRGETWTGEFLLRRKDGSTFMGLVTDAPIQDAEGRLTGVIGVSSDISERRELEEQLRQSQKMEAIGRLAGGVAHDFNNILTVIRGHSQMLLEDLPQDSAHTEDVRQVLTEANRAATLTRQLLAFSRRQVLQERILDVAKALDDMAPMLRRLIPAHIELRFENGDGPRLVRADPGQLHQVILNLAVNAGDAIQDGGSITFRVGGRTVSLTEAREMPWNIEPAAYVELAVEDTGRGIAPDVLDHIFEPFFTTKPEGEGTGLGLSMTFGIVKQSGGHVVVESEPGCGTTFRVLLPVLTEGEALSEEDEDVAVAGRVAPGRGTVLLVEDEPSVRHVSMRMLKRAGYTVLEASNGREALELVGLNGDRIDLVVSDIVMPQVGGLQLLNRLRTLRPDLKIVLTSGYSQEELPAEIRRKGTSFLEKPFSPSELMHLVQAALE